MLKRVENSALRLFQSCLNYVLIRDVFTIDYVKLRRNHAEFIKVKIIKCEHEKKYINAFQNTCRGTAF